MYYLSRQQEFKDLIEGAGFRILCHRIEPKLSAARKLAFFAGSMWIKAVRSTEGKK